MHRHQEHDLDTVVDALLAMDPPVRVAALGDAGLGVTMPSAVPLRGHDVPPTTSSTLELVHPDDVVRVLDAWRETLERGAASTVVRLAGAPDRTVDLHYVDQRPRWGVVLSFVVGLVTADQRLTVQDYLRPRVGAVTKDGIATLLGCDAAVTQMLGWPSDQLVGRRSLELVHPDDHGAAVANWIDMLGSPGASRRVRLRHARADGGWTWVEITNENLLDHPDHGVVRSEVVDISEEMAATEELRSRELLLHTLAEALPLGVVRLGAGGAVAYRNDRLEELLGRQVSGAADLLTDLVDPAPLVAAIAAGRDADVTAVLRRPDGVRHLSVAVRAMTADGDAPDGVLLCLTDTTVATELREQLSREARVDGLTGCRRRNAAIDHVDDVLARLGSGGPDDPGSVTVMFVDLDGFKAVNDRFGHATGDALLAAVGARLLGCAGPDDVVGRLGGDEFVVVVTGLASPAAAERAAERLGRLLLEPVRVGGVGGVGGTALVPHASVGSAWTDAPLPADTLVARADAAMYRVKRGRPDRRATA